MSTNYDRMADEASNINDGFEKEYPEEVKTPSGTSNVIRVLEGSNSFRKYWISWTMCDDDSIKPFITENETDGRGIWGKILGDPEHFYRGGYLESKKGQFGKVNVHQAKDPELFKRINEYWNPSYNGTGSCRPRKEYVFNVLHRNPDNKDGKTFNWCSENKHTKLIKMGARAFKAIKVVRDNCGEFDAYDVVFSKQGTGSDTFYSIMKGDIGTQYNKIGQLDDEEKNYERYDLDYISRLASANYILSNLRNTIDRIDSVMGTAYLAELERQKAIEDEIFQQKKEVGTAYVEQSKIIGESTPTQTPQSQTVTTPNSRVPVTSAVMIECGHCHEQIPEGSVTCPKCQGVLLSDCDICHKPFSVFASSCPHCGQIYRTA